MAELLDAVVYVVTPLDMIPVAGAHIRAWRRERARRALLIEAPRAS